MAGKAIFELMIDLGDVRQGCRMLMNAIDGYRQERQNIEHDLTENEKMIERSIYSSARKVLRSSKRILDVYRKMRGPGLAEFNKDLGDLLEEIDGLDRDLRDGGGEDAGS